VQDLTAETPDDGGSTLAERQGRRGRKHVLHNLGLRQMQPD
jgi:hypothetical protein